LPTALHVQTITMHLESRRILILALPVLSAGADAPQAPLAPPRPHPHPYPLEPAPPGPANHESVAPPRLGLGTWRLKDSFANTSAAVATAIEAGYRHIDCAAAYGNQPAVGAGIARGLRTAGLAREDLWVTSKLWNDAHAPGEVAAALDRTLEDLGVDYLDEYLMHWPVGYTGENGTLVEDYIEVRRISKIGGTLGMQWN
jgi:hypothetical protein